MPSEATRSGTRATTISSVLTAATSSPAASPARIAVAPVRLYRTITCAVTITTKPTFAPTDRSKPPTVIDTVTPRATTATIDTDCRMISVLSQVWNRDRASEKTTSSPSSTASSP
nr:hypothetical protein [Frankia nepalensis]